MILPHLMACDAEETWVHYFPFSAVAPVASSFVLVKTVVLQSFVFVELHIDGHILPAHNFVESSLKMG